MEEGLIYRLRKRAEIRRQISTRKSVQEGKPDRIADLLEEAASALDQLQEWADEPCSYGDNCPTFGSNHGMCMYCRSKEALSIPRK